ncbi:MAG: hypothetical protein L0Z49_09895 [Actinobacteria bacterium]|nr:hypothetical protein [Actinomycetota bacterium]MCI0544738.1 hypothetical protein [Actinomycetota bacterium]
MIAALSLGVVVLGVAAGGLAASVTALLFGGALTLAGVGDGAGIGLVIGVVVGFVVAGLIAGWRAPNSPRFHGQVAGLGLAAVVILVARLGGSPAGTGSVVWMAVLAMVVSGLAAWVAGRRRAGST